MKVVFFIFVKARHVAVATGAMNSFSRRSIRQSDNFGSVCLGTGFPAAQDTDSLRYEVVFDSFSTVLLQLTKESLFAAQQLYTKIA